MPEVVSRHFASTHSMSDETGETKGVFEEAMIAMERYGQAVYDDVGLLQVRITFRLVKEKRELVGTYAPECLEFLKKLERSSRNRDDHEALSKLRSMLDNIVEEKLDNVDPDLGLKIVDRLSGRRKKVLTEARDGYARIFRRY